MLKKKYTWVIKKGASTMKARLGLKVERKDTNRICVK